VLGTDKLKTYLQRYFLELDPYLVAFVRRLSRKLWTKFINFDNQHLAVPKAVNFLDKLLRYDHQERHTAKEAMCMRTRSSSNLVGDSSSNPTTTNLKRRNRRRSKKPFSLEESPIDTMADQRTMAELLRAPTEGYAETIVVPPILAEHFELKHSLINMMTSDQFFGLEKDNPHDHIRWFNKITSIIKYKDVPNSAIKLMLFPFSLAGATCRWLEKEPPRSITTWEDLVSKFINKFFPPSRMTNLRNEISSFQQKFDESDVNSSTSSDIAKLTHGVNQQTSVVTTAMTAILKQFQATPPPAFVKAVEEICVTCGGPHPYYQCLAANGNTFPEYRDNIQGYVLAAAGNYNHGNSGYRPPGKLKAITTRSGLVLDGPFVPMPPPFINPKEDERVEETLTDLEHGEFTIKVPPPLVQKAKPPSQ
ncbi:reverse transcriptase domain-containing protein, partial [Tanacetum coccineum]